jgi:serine/threonine protein kinase
LERLEGGVPSGEVLKAVPKTSVMTFDALIALKHQIAVMKLLSSETWNHPNIIKLREVHHSDTHLLIRMQDGGHLDLYKRLRAREQKEWLLTVPKTESVMKQLMDAICHMHSGPQVVHRDIKPENIIISETKSEVRLFVSDFDTARIMTNRCYCRGICGTFPFFAPEVVLENKYDPYAADIWSTGMVFLELVCCLSVLKKALGLIASDKKDSRQERARKEKAMTGKIYECFSDANTSHALLDWYVRQDLKCLKEYMIALVDGMLNVHHEQRWTQAEVKEAADKLNTIAMTSITEPPFFKAPEVEST